MWPYALNSSGLESEKTKEKWYHKFCKHKHANSARVPIRLACIQTCVRETGETQRDRHLELIVVSLGPPYARMVSEVGLNEVRKLRVDVERVGDFGHAGRLLVLLCALSLPEPLLVRLARRCAAVDGRAGAAVAGRVGLCGRGAVVGGKEGEPGAAELVADGAGEVELAQLVARMVHLRGAAVDTWCALAHRWRVAYDICARRTAASVVSGYGQGFVLGIVVGRRLNILAEGHGSSRAHPAGGNVARSVAEDEALQSVNTMFKLYMWRRRDLRQQS